jgi:hypothetical protein
MSAKDQPARPSPPLTPSRTLCCYDAQGRLTARIDDFREESLAKAEDGSAPALVGFLADACRLGRLVEEPHAASACVTLSYDRNGLLTGPTGPPEASTTTCFNAAPTVCYDGGDPQQAEASSDAKPDAIIDPNPNKDKDSPPKRATGNGR